MYHPELQFNFGANFAQSVWNISVSGARHGARWQQHTCTLRTKPKPVAKHGYSDLLSFGLRTQGVVWLDSLSLAVAHPGE